MKKGVQAKDISDAEALGAIASARGRHGVDRWACTWDIQEVLCAYPPKVVLAKLCSLKRRRLVDGCPCGCRGDWEILAVPPSSPQTSGRHAARVALVEESPGPKAEA